MRCDACATDQGPLMKVSLGKDFFGRPYDRLSPASDQHPKWFCEPCSLQKSLQRDFRDIKAEYEKLTAGQPSAISDGEEFQRAQLRLREIAAILTSAAPPARMIEPGDVATLIEGLRARTRSPSVSS
jgi:hypothetical protein